MTKYFYEPYASESALVTEKQSSVIRKVLSLFTSFLIKYTFIKNENQAAIVILAIAAIAIILIYTIFISEEPIDQKYIYDPAIHNQ